MKAIKTKPLSKAHKELPFQERMEQAMTDLEIDSMEKDMNTTELEIAVMELQDQITN